MRSDFLWISFLILPWALVWSRPVQVQQDNSNLRGPSFPTLFENSSPDIPKSNIAHEEQVISVRITSSVAVERGKGNKSKILQNSQTVTDSHIITPATESTILSSMTDKNEINGAKLTASSADLSGANLEFIKQLQSKKERRLLHNFENDHSFEPNIKHDYSNEPDDSMADSSVTSILRILGNEEENTENVPLGRSLSLSPSSKNLIHSQSQKQVRGNNNSPILTTVSFNIVHDTPKITNNYKNPSDLYMNQNQTLTSTPKFYETPKIYNEISKIYSQPAQVYSEPAKIYSEPAKIYSEPAKVYSEPAKVYSEPAKIYSEPAKFYSQPASLHLPVESAQTGAPWLTQPKNTESTVFNTNTTPLTTLLTQSTVLTSTERDKEQPEKNYEVDEKLSVSTDGRSHGIQDEYSNDENCKQENCKVGYVVEGRQYRKYRVEERTSDGFIVGEYGVVRNEDGALRGVRYTADSEASPRLIYDALMKFLQLK